jgi:Cys-rich protein (TIGR01571 family)
MKPAMDLARGWVCCVAVNVSSIVDHETTLYTYLTGLLATIQHTRTRKAYGIKGDIASDCVRATCCTCCTLIQDEKEIQRREEQRGRATLERGATLLSPYTAPGPMTYPPPPGK